MLTILRDVFHQVVGSDWKLHFTTGRPHANKQSIVAPSLFKESFNVIECILF